MQRQPMATFGIGTDARGRRTGVSLTRNSCRSQHGLRQQVRSMQGKAGVQASRQSNIQAPPHSDSPSLLQRHSAHHIAMSFRRRGGGACWDDALKGARTPMFPALPDSDACSLTGISYVHWCITTFTCYLRCHSCDNRIKRCRWPCQ
jgi:hypothetical protein